MGFRNMNELENLYWSSGIVKFAYWTLVNIVAGIIVIFLYLLKPFRHIKLFRVKDERVGHLADHTELLLRRIKLGIVKSKGITFVGIASTNPSNVQLLNMFRRNIKIVQLPQPGFMKEFFVSLLSEKSLLGKSEFFQPITVEVNEYYEFNNAKTSLSLTREEERMGKELLKRMGIPEGTEFICLHTRDASYGKKLGLKTESYSIRDVDIKTYIRAMKYLASKGIYVIRMGSAVSERLPDLKDKRIIDYATKFRSDFGDIYLAAKCKFFLATTSGMWAMAAMFDVPIVATNFFHFHTPYKKTDMFIPKKVWLKSENRFWTISEVLDWQHEMGHPAGYVSTEDVENAKLKIVDNTEGEILDLIKEMNERMERKFKETKEDKKLQRKYRSLLKPEHNCYGSPARIGSKFLRENKKLLD